MDNQRLNLEWVPAAYSAEKISSTKEKPISSTLPKIVKSTGIYPTKKGLKQKMCKR